MWLAGKWKDYTLIDCGDGERYEKWGPYYLSRPDPQAIWPKSASWEKLNARYRRSGTGGGSWEIFSLPEKWIICYGSLRFQVRPMNFKHMGVFPEQAVNWDFLTKTIADAGRPLRVLNLFAYSGGASLACASAGAQLVHVDAAKGMVSLARENAALSGLSGAPVRWIVDDCVKFVRREISRGHKYDGIIMDPPSYGRGPSGEIWRFESDIWALVESCVSLLSDDPAFFVISCYTGGVSPLSTEYILSRLLLPKFGGKISSAELALPVKATGLSLACGHTARWFAS